MKYSELSEKAKARACEDNRFYNVDDQGWYEFTLEMLAEDLESLGFEESDIYFRGFASKGDGACFDPSSFNVEILFSLYAQDVVQYSEMTFADGTPVKLSPAQRAVMRHFDWCCDIMCNELYLENNQTHNATHYCHENTRHISGYFMSPELEDFKLLSQIAENFVDFVEELRKDKSIEIYRTLEKEHDWYCEDDQIGESLEANEVEFNDDGSEV